MYDFICKNNLQDEVYKRFGKSFTNMSNVLLESFINSFLEEEDEEDQPEVSEDYAALKEKYDSLVGAVASLLCSIDSTEALEDVNTALKSIMQQISED